MLFEIAKNSFFLQNAVVNIVTGIHPSIMHNLGKMEIIKKALFHCELEDIQGSYFEFGVFEGTSLLAAVKAHGAIKSKIRRRFYGFDSFDEGFKYFQEDDNHPFFKEGDFTSSFKRVKKRLSRYHNIKLIKGYFEKTVKGRPREEICGSDRCAVLFIDCDLKGPAAIALEFARPLLQKGSVIILDDYWAYRGSMKKGTAGALEEFLGEHGGIEVRRYHDYGYGGASFIVTACPENEEKAS